MVAYYIRFSMKSFVWGILFKSPVLAPKMHLQYWVSSLFSFPYDWRVDLGFLGGTCCSYIRGWFWVTFCSCHVNLWIGKSSTDAIMNALNCIKLMYVLFSRSWSVVSICCNCCCFLFLLDKALLLQWCTFWKNTFDSCKWAAPCQYSEAILVFSYLVNVFGWHTAHQSSRNRVGCAFLEQEI
jgi:hypothetical protein